MNHAKLAYNVSPIQIAYLWGAHMSAKFNLLSDSTCDFSLEDSTSRDVEILSFSYTEAGKPDGGFHGLDDQFQERSAHEFYEAIRQGAAPMTSQPSQMVFESAFRKALDTGLPSVVFCISSGISGGYNGAVTALDRLKEEMGTDDLPIYIVDCLITSSAQYLLVEEAVRMRDAGATAEEVYEWALEARYHVRTIFMVDNLDTLHRGGRIPKSVALVAGALDAKPLLNFNLDGSLGIIGVTRGRAKGMKKLVKHYADYHDDAPYGPVVSIGNADCPDDLDRLAEMLREVNPDLRVLTSTIGPTIGCHVGPGMLSCCFWGADRRKGKGYGKVKGVRQG